MEPLQTVQGVVYGIAPVHLWQTAVAVDHRALAHGHTGQTRLLLGLAGAHAHRTQVVLQVDIRDFAGLVGVDRKSSVVLHWEVVRLVTGYVRVLPEDLFFFFREAGEVQYVFQ